MLSAVRISDEQRRHRLARRHLLVDREERDAATIADRLVALHSSDPASVYLSIAARSPGTTVAAIGRALYDDRVVVRHHAMRRTLWVMSPPVAEAAHAAATAKIAVAERARTAKLLGRDARWVDEGVDRVTAAVADSAEPVSTRTVGDLLPDLADKITVNQGRNHQGTMAAHTRLLLQAGFEGRIVRTRPSGSWVGSQYAWTTSERWTSIDWDRHDRESGHRDLVGRWLAAFGPGTLDDIVWWTGSTKTAIRRALAEIDAREVELGDGSIGYVTADDDPAADDDPGAWVALLPGLDPTPMGWKQREWYLSGEVAERVVDRNGNIGPTVWVDGRVTGGWAQRPDGEIAHDADVPPSHHALLDAEIERLRAFVGDTRFRCRFPSPNQPMLLA